MAETCWNQKVTLGLDASFCGYQWTPLLHIHIAIFQHRKGLWHGQAGIAEACQQRRHVVRSIPCNATWLVQYKRGKKMHAINPKGTPADMWAKPQPSYTLLTDLHTPELPCACSIAQMSLSTSHPHQSQKRAPATPARRWRSQEAKTTRNLCHWNVGW